MLAGVNWPLRPLSQVLFLGALAGCATTRMALPDDMEPGELHPVNLSQAMGSNFELAFGEYLLATVEGNGPPYVGSPAPPSLVWKDLLQSELPLRVENRRTKKVISARCTEAPRQEAPLESQHWARCAYFSEPVRSGEATEPSSGSRHIQVATMELSKE